MIRVEAVWLALGASDLRGGIDRLLAMVVQGFALGAQPHHAYVFANRRADRLKVLVYPSSTPNGHFERFSASGRNGINNLAASRRFSCSGTFA